MIIIGSKFYGHDSAIYQIDTEQKTVFAASTERISRKKHDDDFGLKHTNVANGY